MIIQFCIMHGYIPIFLVNFPRNWISIPYHHISPVSRGICERLKEVKAMIAKKKALLEQQKVANESHPEIISCSVVHVISGILHKAKQWNQVQYIYSVL